MKKRSLYLICFLAIALSLSLFAVSCDSGKQPGITTSPESTVATESGSTEAPTLTSTETETVETETTEATTAPVVTDTEPDGTEPDGTEPDGTEPIATETDTTKTDVTETDATETDADKTDADKTDVTESEDTETDSAQDATTESDTQVIDTEDADTDTKEDGTTEEKEDADKSETTAPVDTEADETQTDGDIEIPDDPYEDTEGEDEEETLAPGVCPEHPNKFAYNSSHHWRPQCEICGYDKQTTPQPHVGYGVIEDEGDVLLYSYFCRYCQGTIARIEVPYDVNLYIDPMELGEVENNYGGESARFDTTYGIPSMRFTSQNGTGNSVTVYSNDNTSIPTGQWAVMKLKLGNGRSSFTLGVSTLTGKKGQSAAKDSDGIVNATLTGLPAGWVTVIVDLSKIVKDDAGYQPDDNGEYYLCRYKFLMNGSSALERGDRFDMAYVAFFDNLEDAKEFTADERARYIYTDVLEDNHPEVDGDPCVHNYTQTDAYHHSYDACDICKDDGGTIEHKYNFINVETFDDGRISQYQIECICGNKSTLKTVPEDVNYYTVPSKIHLTNVWHGYTHGTVGLDDGDVYQRIYLAGNPENGHGGTVPLVTTGDLANFDTVQNGSGRYFLIKLRAHEVNVIALRLATRADNDRLTMPADGHPNSHQWSEYNDQWVTVVIDLYRLSNTGLANQVSQYIVDDEAIKQVSVGLQCQKTGGEEVEGYLDIAYFAICDTWAQIAEITGEEKVFVTAWAGNAAFAEATTDGNIQCEDHIPKLYISEDKKTYSYRCAICDKPYETRTLTTDVNYYSAPGQQTNSWNSGGLGSNYATPGTLMLDEEGQFIYNHITLEKGGAFEFLNGSTAKEVFVKGFDNVHDTIYGGTGKYMVLKMRVGSEEQLSLLAWDGVTGNDVEYAEGFTYFADGKLNSDKVFSLAVRTTALNSDWTVYVIDMEKVFGATYDTENTDITKVTFGIKGDFTADASASEYVDIAYMAIVDEWDEVEDVVGTEEIVLYTDWKTPFNDETRKTDGTVTQLPECETHADIVMDSVKVGTVTTYRYSCPVCRKIFENRTVTDDINYYSAPSTKMAFNNWNTGKATSGALYVGGIDIYEDGDTSFPYTRISMQNGGSFEMLNGSYAVTWEEKGFDTAHDSIRGAGKYMVIKLRMGANETSLSILAWDGVTGNDVEYAEGVTYFADGKLNSDKVFGLAGRSTGFADGWAVYVIDMEKAFPTMYDAGNKDISNATFGFKGDGNGGSYDSATGEWKEYDEDDYVDIAYFAICDEWAEIKAIVGEENVILTDWKTPGNDREYTSSGQEVVIPPCEQHEIPEVVKETVGTTVTYSYVCPACKHTLASKSMTDDVNYYSLPTGKELIFNNWNTGDATGYSSKVGDLGIYQNGDKSFAYTRVTLQKGGSFEILNGSYAVTWKEMGFNTVHDTIKGSGKYMVVKLRMGANETSLSILAWDGVTGKDAYFDSTTGKLASDTVFGKAARTTKLSTDWVVYVIDMEEAFSETYKTGDVDLTKATFGFKGDYDGGEYKNDEWTGYDKDDYVDIAYFAICDNWVEIADVVGDEDVILTDWKTPGNDKKYTSSGVEILPPACETHAELEYVKVVGKTETTHKYVCPECTHTLAQTVVSNDVNYYVAPNANSCKNVWNTGSKTGYDSSVGIVEMMDAEVDFVYAHVTLQTHGAFELINGSGAYAMRFHTVHDTVNGSGKYAVLKIRVGSGEDTVKLLAWDGITGNETYYNSSNSQLDSDSVFNLCARSNLNTEWAIYVIDLSQAFGETYDAENADITKATFGIKGDGSGGNYDSATATWSGFDENDYIDIAYFAICDNWTEIQSVVGDESVILTNWKTPANDVTVNVSEKVAQENQ